MWLHAWSCVPAGRTSTTVIQTAGMLSALSSFPSPPGCGHLYPTQPLFPPYTRVIGHLIFTLSALVL